MNIPISAKKIDVKNATKIFNSGEVELVASGVTRQETARLIQENCTLSVTKDKAKKFNKILKFFSKKYQLCFKSLHYNKLLLI